MKKPSRTNPHDIQNYDTNMQHFILSDNVDGIEVIVILCFLVFLCVLVVDDVYLRVCMCAYGVELGVLKQETSSGGHA